MTKRKVVFISVLITILIALLFSLVFYHSRKGYIKIITDFPDIQYSINGKEIDATFDLVNGKYKTTQPVGLGKKVFKASTEAGRTIKEKEFIVRDGETVEVIIELERDSFRDYLLEGE